MPRFIGIRTAATEYHISRGQIYKAIKTNQLKAYKPGGRRLLVKREDFESWIENYPA